MSAVFDMSAEASEGAVLLARIDERTARFEGKIDALDRMIRGDGVEQGIIGRLAALEAFKREVRDDFADLRQQLALKMFPKANEPATIKARAEAWAIRIGAGAGIVTVLIEGYTRLFGG